jgi:hypothetical protein
VAQGHVDAIDPSAAEREHDPRRVIVAGRDRWPRERRVRGGELDAGVQTREIVGARAEVAGRGVEQLFRGDVRPDREEEVPKTPRSAPD